MVEHRRGGPENNAAPRSLALHQMASADTSTMQDTKNPRHLDSRRCMPLKMNQNRVGQSRRAFECDGRRSLTACGPFA